MIGIRYLIIAIGGPDNHATDDDVEKFAETISEMVAPFEVTVLSERTSNRLTWHLIQEVRDAKT